MGFCVKDGRTKTTYKLAGGMYEVIVDGSTTTQKSYVDGVILNNRTLTNGTQSANDTLYLHTDHLGSTEATTNALGQFVNRMSFGAWGERQKSDWKPGNPTETFLTTNGFTGHDQLDSHNLVHMGGRVYDPSLGRFLSADIVVQSPYDSQNYNRYSYVGNNPLSYTDPSGYSRSRSSHYFHQDFAIAMQQAGGCSPAADACGVRNSSRLTGDAAVWYLQGLAYTNSDNLTAFYGGAFYDPKYFGQNALFKEGIAQANADLANALKNAEPDHTLTFNGTNLQWMDGKGNILHTWGAVSGRPSHGSGRSRTKNYTGAQSQSIVDRGPIPEGRWLVKQGEFQKRDQSTWQKIKGTVGAGTWPGGHKSWGDYRIWLAPLGDTKTYGRSGFSIHGGLVPGSAGCIDLCGLMPDFSQKFQSYGKDMELTVKY